jgi:anti-sigma-K factor RskA
MTDNMLAAELVLGLLTPELRADAERRLASDAAFAGMVASWRAHLAELDDTAEPLAPAGDLWPRIEQGIAAPAPAARASQPGALQRFWSSLGALRMATLGGTTAALVFAVLAAASLQHAQEVAARKPVYVAILVDDASRQPGAVVNAFADGRVQMIPLTDINVPEGRVLEIWTLWDRAVGPRSVGLIPRARTTRLNLDKLPATGVDQLFEITLEPAGGSPIGRPTGPVLYKGTTTRAL